MFLGILLKKVLFVCGAMAVDNVEGDGLFVGRVKGKFSPEKMGRRAKAVLKGVALCFGMSVRIKGRKVF